MSIKKYLIGIVGLGFVIISCTKEEQQFTDSPILESYLKPGQYFTVKVSRQIPFISNAKLSENNINKLDIQIVHDGKTDVLSPLDSGQYIDSNLLVRENDEYDLSFSFNSKNVSAYTYIPTKPEDFTQSTSKIYITKMDSSSIPSFGSMPDPIELTWTNDDDSYYLVVVENMESSLDPIRDFGDNDPPGNAFRKSPTNGNTEMLNSIDFQYYGKHRVILYHVLPDYASLYDRNSTSSQNLTNPSTSIINGYGIFTGMNSDTLYVEVKEQ